MLTNKDKNVITELFNISFSKSISRLSVLLDDRLDISVPTVISTDGNEIDNIFKNSNLIFNDVKGVVNYIKDTLEGNYAFLVEYNDHLKNLIDELDMETINQVFIDTVSNTLNSLLDSNIELVKSSPIINLDDLLNILKNNDGLKNRNIIFSRWSTRSNNISGYIFLLVNTEKFIKLPKFVELFGLS